MAEPNPAEAIQALFDRYGDEIFAHVHLSVGRREDAEDLVQDIFLRALKAWPRFEHRSQARTWLWAITKNRLREYYRIRSRASGQLETMLGVAEPEAATADPSDAIFLQQALSALPPVERQVFILRVIQDRSSRETATLLGCSDVRVRVTLHRAMKHLEAWWNGGKSSRD